MVGWWTLVLYPELEQVEPRVRAAALARARERELDGVEWTGIGLAMVLAVVATRYSVPEDIAHRFASAVANFAIAVPLLVVLAGPFHVRRVRRGLRELRADARH